MTINFYNADTFVDSPPSGNLIEMHHLILIPVQGFSGVQFALGSEDESTYWFLSDNGMTYAGKLRGPVSQFGLGLLQGQDLRKETRLRQ